MNIIEKNNDPLKNHSSFDLENKESALLAAIVQYSDDAIISKNLNGIIQSWNAAAQRLFGYLPEDVIGKSITILIPPDRLKEEEEIINHIKKGERVEHFETKRVTKDSRLLDVSISTSPVIDKFGIIIGASKIVRDITDIKIKLREIEESHGLIKVIFEESVQFMSILSPEGNLIKYNTTAKQYIGGDEINLLNIPFWLTPWWTHSEEVREKIHNSILMAKQGQFVRFDISLRTFEGKIIFLDFSIKPVKDNNDKILFLIPEGRDITERKSIELDLISAKEFAERAIVIKSRFLDIAAHELRTPVTSFSLIVQLAQKKLDKGIAVTADTLLRLRSQSERISRLVVDLLDVSRLERNAINLKLESSDILVLFSDYLIDYKILRPNREINFVKPNHQIFVNMDSVRILQVFSNLLDNACKYTPDDSPIDISIQEKQSTVRVSIKDFGPGIPPEQQRELFSPFTRGSLELTGRSGGLGLGLYVSRMIIELHGGSIGLVSQIGKGSLFYFEIPLAQETPNVNSSSK